MARSDRAKRARSAAAGDEVPAAAQTAGAAVPGWAGAAPLSELFGSEEQPAAAIAETQGQTQEQEQIRQAPSTSEAGAEPVIELRGVRKVYRSGDLEFEALKGVDLTIDEGEYVAIMGPSGSGKSTLMNILGCLDVATSGSYRLGGEDVAELDETKLAHIRGRRIGFVFQQFHLLPSLSAVRNVELPLVYAGFGKARRRELASLALERVGLGDRLHNRPGELSGGQQQRVAVARALVGTPTMILADEPTGNLDSAATEDVLGLFDELHAAGRTIVLITHEAEVGERARRLVRVRDGLVQDGERALAAPGQAHGAGERIA